MILETPNLLILLGFCCLCWQIDIGDRKWDQDAISFGLFWFYGLFFCLRFVYVRRKYRKYRKYRPADRSWAKFFSHLVG